MSAGLHGFGYDEHYQCWDIYWGGYEYNVHLERVGTPEALLGWVTHLGEKGWPDMTIANLVAWIEDVAHRRGWKLHPL